MFPAEIWIRNASDYDLCERIQKRELFASREKSMIESDGYCRREYRLDFSEHGFPVFALPGSIEIVQKLNLDYGQDDSSRLTGLPETRIALRSYTILPWED